MFIKAAVHLAENTGKKKQEKKKHAQGKDKSANKSFNTVGFHFSYHFASRLYNFFFKLYVFMCL